MLQYYVPSRINGIIGLMKINNIYVNIPINPDKIKRLPLLPYLSTITPNIGIIIDEIRKGRAIAIPTLC
jgi:hypothetical protein